MAKQEMSEYERERQANIAQKNALLKELALRNAAATAIPRSAGRPAGSKSSTTANNNKNKKKKDDSAAAVKKERIQPTRHSSRIAGIEADSEVAKRRAEEDYHAEKEAQRIKRQRVSGDLDLGDIVVAGGGWSRGENPFTGIAQRGANPYERTFGEDEVKKTTDKELRALRERMSGLELYDGWEPNRIKITPERIYSLAFHPDPSKPIVFAGDKMGNMGIFDASQAVNPVPKVKPIKSEGLSENGDGDEDDDDDDDDTPPPMVTSFKLHTRTISAFKFSPDNQNELYTSSYDSSLRVLDLATSKSAEVYGPADGEADEPLSGVEVDAASPSVVYFSRLDGHIGRHDRREGATRLWELSEKKIGGFSLHPGQPQFLATASLDRTMRVWDLRKMVAWEGGRGRRPAMLGEHFSRLSVSHAAFNAAGQVATASYDDTVKIHSFRGMGDWAPGRELSDEEMEPSTVIRHNNQTGRWVTILRAQWQARPQDGVQRFCIGNMNRFVDIYTANGEQLAQLGGDSITAVPAVAQFHPTNDWIAAGTASGKLCLWM